MAAISGVGSSGGYVPQRPSAAQLATNLFSKLDTNNQGFIDKSQLESALAQAAPAGGAPAGAPSADDIFSKLDGNNDGKLTKQEFTDGVQKLADQLNSQFNQSRVRRGGGEEQLSPDQVFSTIDTKNQGFIDKTELESAFQSVAPTGAASSADLTKQADALFAKLDGNNDGQVSRQEFSDAVVKVSGGNDGGGGAQHGHVRGGGPGGPGGAQGPGGPPPAGGRGDGDGGGGSTASTGSTSSSSGTNYDPADSNKDGKVSAAELAAYQATEAQKKADSGSAGQQNSNASILRTLFHLARAYAQQDAAAAQSGVSATA